MLRFAILATIVVSQAFLSTGCSSQSAYQPTGNGILDMRNPNLLVRDRITAAESAWAEVLEGARDRDRTRQALKNLAWSRATQPELRYTALDLLMSDRDPAGSADSEQMARLLLPSEPDRQAVRIVLTHTIRAGWNDGMLPAVIRSYSRFDPNVPDTSRMERAALEALAPGEPIESVVFRVFLDPATGSESERERAILRSSERTRDAAWGLLARLDPSEQSREQLLRSDAMLSGASEDSQRAIQDLRAGYRDFGVIPDRALELSWLRQLRRSDDPEWSKSNEEWWSASSAAVRGLDASQRDGLELRHIEPIRWASLNEPSWLNASQSELFGILAQNLAGRNVHKRQADSDGIPRRERLDDWRNTLSWGDLLTLLVIDQRMQDREVRERLFMQATLDRKDRKTEYGGIIDEDTSGAPRAVLFRPRMRDRTSDTRFVASEDMMRFSDRALAHYHMHANKRNNNKYAGPSLADLVNVQNSGRNSIVFTTLKDDLMNVDVYFPEGPVIDLGEISRP